MFDAICFLHLYRYTYICMPCVHIHVCIYPPLFVCENFCCCCYYSSKSIQFDITFRCEDGWRSRKKNKCIWNRSMIQFKSISFIHPYSCSHTSIHPSYNNSNKVETSSCNNSHLILYGGQTEIHMAWMYVSMWFIMCHLNVKICKIKNRNRCYSSFYVRGDT